MNERIKALKAMMLLAKSCKNPRAVEYWHENGIAEPDGEPIDEWLEFYTDEDIDDIISAFRKTMHLSGGLSI